MIDLLIQNPLLLLFVVSAIGYLLGRIRIGGVSLGVAAVLFVGLAFGALNPELRLPEIIYLLGLVLFVYTIGLSSGPGFFASLQRKGLRDNLLVLGVIALAALLTVAAYFVIGVSAPVAAGMFAGSLTNTPALAGVIEQLKQGGGAALSDAVLAEPVVGYSVTYPMGVLGMILAIYLAQRLWKVDYALEARSRPDLGAGTENLVNRTVRVTRPAMDGRNVGELIRTSGWDVVFGRVQRDGHPSIATSDAYLKLNDLVSVIGQVDEVDRVIATMGELAPEPLELDRHTLDFRRVFVSNPAVAGKRLRELDLPRSQGAIITRVRRGDADLLPHGDTVLELGDRVRVVTRRENLEAVSKYFGDSYRHLSEIDVVSLGLGLALGLLLGMVPIPLPGIGSFTLGFAGGPLIVALFLGWLERSGPIVWSLPYSANLTLRQLGLTLFLAGVGTRSGYSFVSTLAQGGGLSIFLAGALITCAAALALLVVGHRLLKIPLGLCVGILAGLQTQPAVLAFAAEQTKNDLPNIGYATVYPVATIAKIVAAQVILVLLS
ncbi:MAG TPA: aspartate:alanine exchanger family transporter [Chloroflexaceae bacterium]|nr:aspartate:alanine exchanger family transporter [Chloroflexaceae bacterium]